MRNPILVLILLFGTAPSALAQTEGRIGVGASVTFNHTTDDGIRNAITAGPLVRLNPRPGWRAVGALNWFEAELRNPAGGDADFGKLRVRPLMGGQLHDPCRDRHARKFFRRRWTIVPPCQVR